MPKSATQPAKPSARVEMTCANGYHVDYKVVDDAVNSGDIAHYCPRCQTFWIYSIYTEQTVEQKYLPDHLADK